MKREMYDVAQLSERGVERLRTFEQQFQEEMGEEIILIAYDGKDAPAD